MNELQPPLSIAHRLEPGHREIVRCILATHCPGARVLVSGSRATGRPRPGSDLDLLFVEPPALTWELEADLRDAFEASELPFRVDLVPLQGLEPSYRERVLGEAVDL